MLRYFAKEKMMPIPTPCEKHWGDIKLQFSANAAYIAARKERRGEMRTEEVIERVEE